MIVDREGDLVMTDGEVLMLDVGGFLLKPKPAEIAERVDRVFALLDRKAKRLGRQAIWLPQAPHPGLLPIAIVPLEPVAAKLNGQPVNLEVEQTVSPDGVITLTAECVQPPASFQAAWIEPPPEIFPSLARAEPRPGGVTKRAGTLLLLDLTEQQQLDSCTGR